jgi:pimeloyl-ACP methyl ester carboxylesterase
VCIFWLSAVDNPRLNFLEVGTGNASRRIAFRRREGAEPALLWLGGFKSDMQGTKAQALDRWALQRRRAITRFDYSGHGESGGEFAQGTIGRWLEESLAVFDACCRGPQVVIGSSMGAWLALLLTRAVMERRERAASQTQLRHARACPAHPRLGAEEGVDGRDKPGHDESNTGVAGLVLIAPAVDFTEELMWKRFPPEAKRAIEQAGSWLRPSQYSAEPYLITRGLIEDGRRHLLLAGMIETGCPVRILQGVQDADVPWQHAVELTARFAQDDVVLTLVKDGDHRLSRPEDIERLIAAVAEF